MQASATTGQKDPAVTETDVVVPARGLLELSPAMTAQAAALAAGRHGRPRQGPGHCMPCVMPGGHLAQSMSDWAGRVKRTTSGISARGPA